MQSHRLFDEAIQEGEIHKFGVIKAFETIHFVAQRFLDIWTSAELQQQEVEVHPRLVRRCEPDAQERLGEVVWAGPV